MAIDKESLKKQNTRNLFEKSKKNVKKSSDISLSNSGEEDIIIEKRKVYDSKNGLFQKKTVALKAKDITPENIKKLDKALKYEKNRKSKYRRVAIEAKRFSNTQNGSNEDTAAESLTVFKELPLNGIKKTLSKASKPHYKVMLPDGTVVKGKGSIGQTFSNISQKSNMLKPNTVHSSSKQKPIAKKKRYKKNRRRIFNRKNKQAKKKAASKMPVISRIKQKISKGFIKGTLGILAFILGNWLLLMPVILIVFAAGGEAYNEAQSQIQYTYPASDADITQATTYWQALQVQIKAKLDNVPGMDGIAGNFDTKSSSVCDFMNDNNALLSFISAYYIPYVDAWHFEDAQDLITEVFSKMYVINYTIKDRQLEYKITEAKSWDDILNEYLNDEQKKKYQDYYEHKGGAVKAFSSPFAFDWSGYITSPFGYRDWGGGNVEFHKGLDFGVARGTEELAIADGVIVTANNSCTHDYSKDGNCCGDGYGRSVVIQTDDGYFIRYGHMQDVYVNVGDTVKNGQPIGTAGCTGWSTGVHLHLEVRSGGLWGDVLDPMNFIQDYVPIEDINNKKNKEK